MALGNNLKDHENAKMANAKMADMQNMCGQTQRAPYRPPTLREEAEKQIGYHREQADRFDLAAAFFREHPEFDEFVRLVRSGAIQF